jgi:hypothetical protein
LAERELKVWAEAQKNLARALGLSIEDWMRALSDASKRKTGLTAAVIGASVARGLGMSVLDQLDAEALFERAQSLIDPEPPRVENPVLAEAIRRADEIGSGGGARRLKKAERPEISTPQRGRGSIGNSATASTPDAPGRGEEE